MHVYIYIYINTCLESFYDKHFARVEKKSVKIWQTGKIDRQNFKVER